MAELTSCSPNPERMTASVALASFQGGRYLEAQLASIVAQSDPPDEIVVTDDGSTDETYAILARFASSSSIPIRIIKNSERLGFTRNFARAISLCRSELIFLCDQDDIWANGKIERMKEEFKDPDVLLAYHGALVVSEENEPLYEFYQTKRERKYLQTLPMDPWYSSYGLTQAFRASLRKFDDLWPVSLNHVWLENETLSHDQWYFFLAQVLGRVAYVGESLVRYRQHGTNSVGAKWVDTGGGVFRRVARKFSHEPRLDHLRSRAAERRALILSRISERMDPGNKEDSAILSAYYGILQDRLGRRYDCYTAQTILKRASAFAKMIRFRDYRAAPWGFRVRSIGRDFVRGVVVGSTPLIPKR